MKLSDITWDDFQRLGLEQKGGYFHHDGQEDHVLIAQQFDRERLDTLGQLATQIRLIAKSEEGMRFLQSLLHHKRAMLYFTQPSTRTFLSFNAACQILGIRAGHVRNKETSSELKGETQEDSVRTFSSYYDMIVMRTQEPGLAERMAWVLSNSERPVPIINAGSGSDQHPTQALLDIYTLQRSFEERSGVDGKTVVFVGDLKYGRTVRSLASLLMNYEGVKQRFVAPDELQVGRDVLDRLKAAGVDYELSNDLNAILPQADAVYMTRVQDEWAKSLSGARQAEDGHWDLPDYSFGLEQLALLKQDAIIMHPLPRRSELGKEIDSDPRAMYWRQMRNGMWIRTALISVLFRKDSEIQDYYQKNL